MDSNNIPYFGSSSSSSSSSHVNSFMHGSPSMPHQSMDLMGGAMDSCPNFMQLQQQQLQLFWQQQMIEVQQISEFKQHHLPLARIKKIMKSDQEVKMISAEAPVLFSKACELFILELTLRSWLLTEENKRRTLQRSDISGAINRTEVLDFLIDAIPSDDIEDCTGENYVGNEPLPYIGLQLPCMQPPPFNQNIHPDLINGQQEFIPQQTLPSDQIIYYDPPQ